MLVRGVDVVDPGESARRARSDQVVVARDDGVERAAIARDAAREVAGDDRVLQDDRARVQVLADPSSLASLAGHGVGCDGHVDHPQRAVLHVDRTTLAGGARVHRQRVVDQDQAAPIEEDPASARHGEHSRAVPDDGGSFDGQVSRVVDASALTRDTVRDERVRTCAVPRFSSPLRWRRRRNCPG